MQKFLNYDIKDELILGDPNKARFVIKPLERGFGTTLGNALRRVCLSNIPGASIFAIKIPGVTHIFQAMPGVYEDIAQIVLNLKKLVIKIDNKVYSEETFENTKMEEWPTLKVNFSGPGDITGHDLICPAGFEIVNPDLHIATITEKINFEMEIFAKSGRGFKTSDENKEGITTLSIIPTDSNFSPVLSFNYESEEVKTSKTTDTDILTIELSTNGSMSAHEAISLAARILILHFEQIAKLDENQQIGLEMFDKKEEPKKNVSLFIPIEELDLTVRAYNALKTAGINNLQELTEHTKDQIEKIKNLGRKSVTEIIKKIQARGLKLRDE